ncbi:MAG: HPr family phosphocarrier protein [Oscillospiraceae bacterium]|nr:HPr family phosphocarrier protein [Oscillospiraceae bacterium]
MKTFEYTVTDGLGIHARPAGLIAKAAKEFSSEIVILKDGRSAVCTKVMAIMGLCVKCGDRITVTITGGDEEAAEKAMRELFEANL